MRFETLLMRWYSQSPAGDHWSYSEGEGECGRCLPALRQGPLGEGQRGQRVQSHRGTTEQVSFGELHTITISSGQGSRVGVGSACVCQEAGACSCCTEVKQAREQPGETTGHSA